MVQALRRVGFRLVVYACADGDGQLGCREVRYPGGMVKGGSPLEGILLARLEGTSHFSAYGFHGGARLLRIDPSSQRCKDLMADLEPEVV